MRCAYRLIPSLEIGDIDLDEDIARYWDALDDKDRKWAKGEAEYYDKQIGLKLLTPNQMEALQSSQMTDRKTLQGCHSYDILANPLYFDDFQYVSAERENRAEFIIDDDDEEGNDIA